MFEAIAAWGRLPAAPTGPSRALRVPRVCWAPSRVDLNSFRKTRCHLIDLIFIVFIFKLEFLPVSCCEVSMRGCRVGKGVFRVVSAELFLLH